MARINKVRFGGWLLLLCSLLLLVGCSASMQARSAFEEAELLAAEENLNYLLLKKILIKLSRNILKRLN
jgi:hypothetical protein